MTDNQEQARHHKFVTPTLFIGLGGTGREVLLRIRQEMVLEFGVAALPVHKFVWIDCDPNVGDQMDNKPFDWLLPAAQLDPGRDTVAATVDANIFEGYATNPAANKWLYKWVDPGIFSAGSITAGAAQVRPRGRCAFYANFSKIQRTLNDALTEICEQPAKTRLYDQFDGMQAGTTQRIFIFNSLAGGTGSGMFLDVAFLCRQIASNDNRDVDIFGYEFLPSVFAPVGESSAKLYANAYAALSELEFYGLPRDIGEATQATTDKLFGHVADGHGSMKDLRKSLEELLPAGGSKHDFKEYWNREHTKPGYHRGPAFDYCYLIGNTSDSGVELPPGESKGDILDSVAQAVFIESSGHPLATQISSSRDNIKPWLGTLSVNEYQDKYEEETIFQDVWSNLYSSLGFSFIKAPNFNVRFSCAYRLGGDVLAGFTMPDPEPQADVQRYVEELVSKGRLHVKGPDYVDALKIHRDGKDYIESTVNPWASSLSSRIAAGEGEGAWAPMIQQQLQALQARAMAARQGPFEQWGELYQVLETNANRTGSSVCKRDQLQAELNALTASWLEEMGGIDRATARLRGLHKFLLQTILPKLVADRDSEKRAAETSLKAVNGNLGVLTGEEGSRHRKSAQNLALEGVRHAREFLVHRIMYEVMEYAIGLHKDLINGIMISELVNDGGTQVEQATGGLIVELTKFRDRLSGVETYFAEELLKYDRQPEHHIFIELYRKGLYEEFYKTANIDIATERQAFYELIGVSQDRAFGFMRSLIKQGPDWAQRYLEEYCRAKFATATVSIDAVNEVYSTADRDQTLSNLVQRSAPWIRASGVVKDLPDFDHTTKRELRFAYNKEGQGLEYNWFGPASDTELRKEPFRAYRKDTVSSNAPELVLLYSEMGALPLAYIDNLVKYRDAYRKMLGIDGSSTGQVQYFPHIDVTIPTYPEICPSSDDEIQKKRRATQAFLLGMLLGVVELQKDGSGGLKQYSLKLTVGFRDMVIPLGNSRGQAVNTLLSSDDRLDGLEGRVAEVRNSLNREQVIRYAALLRWLTEGAFAKRWIATPLGNRDAFNLEHSVFLKEFDSNEGQILREHHGDTDAGRESLDEAVAEIQSGACPWVEPIEIDGVPAFKLA
jgi:hypothetical protein